jgi:hypothetical protein
MYTLQAIFVTLCAIFPVWVVTTALSIIALVAIIVIVKFIALVLDATPFL